MRYYRFLLVIILAFAFVTRFFRLDYPNNYYFDEFYHAPTAKLMLHNDPQAFEWWHAPPEPNTAIEWLHPPLAKYMQALSMGILGENSFAWRFSSAVMGVLVIYLTALVADQLFKNKTVSIIAAFLASLDGLLLVQSRIAMNDIHVTFFILLSLFFYLRAIAPTSPKKENASLNWWSWMKVGIALGLAISSKWSGFFAIGFLALSELVRAWGIYKKVGWQFSASEYLMRVLRWFVTLIFIPVLLYCMSYGLMFSQGKSWAYFIELHQQIWQYQTELQATHAYQSRPWQWWLNERPVWMFVQRYPDGTQEHIYAFGNPILSWLAVICTVITFVWLLASLTELGQQLALTSSRKKSHQLTIATIKKNSSIAWLWLAYLSVWLPWQFSPRFMMFYHFTPAIPFSSILVAFWLYQVWRFDSLPKAVRITLVGTVLWSIFVSFLLWYPHWTAIGVPKWWADSVYFWRSSWK